MEVDWVRICRTAQQVVALVQEVSRYNAQVEKLLKTLPSVIQSCSRIIQSMQGISNLSAACMQSMSHFAAEVETAHRNLEKWSEAAKGSSGSGLAAHAEKFWNYFFSNEVSVTAMRDMVSSLEGYKTELAVILQAEQLRDAKTLSGSFSEARNLQSVMLKGKFTGYDIIKTPEGRELWKRNFPGLREVPWNEFRNWLSWQGRLQEVSPEQRAVALQKMKKVMDPDSSEKVAIEGFATFLGNRSSLSERIGEVLVVAIYEAPPSVSTGDCFQ